MSASRFSSCRQLAGVLAGFTIAILLLESEALNVWASRLGVGPGREIAVPVTSALRRRLRPIGLERVRAEGLLALDRLGWSDDPARLAAARKADAGGVCNEPSQKAGLVAVPRTNTAERPLLPSVPKLTSLPPLAPVANGKPRTIALVGDSMMAVGLSDVLLRETAANPNVRIVKAFRSGTGLARPDVFDWMKEYPAMVGNEHPDVILVAIGANDGQGFIEADKTLPFGSDAWIRVYQQRISAFANLLSQDGAQVIWIGLPAMKSPQYNDRINLINRIACSVVSGIPNASWWNPAPYVTDASGAFREFVTAPDGKSTRIRQGDGIHLSDEGAELFVPKLVSWFSPPPPPLTAQAEIPEQLPASHRARRTHAARR